MPLNLLSAWFVLDRFVLPFGFKFQRVGKGINYSCPYIINVQSSLEESGLCYHASLGEVGHNRISYATRIHNALKKRIFVLPREKVYVAIWIGSRHKDLYNGMTLAQSLHKMCQSIRKDVNN